MFSKMTGNEILLNMENGDYFRPTEVVGSLSALCHIDEQTSIDTQNPRVEFDWEKHPYVSRVLDRLIELLPQFKKSQIVQTGIILDRLRVKSDRTSFPYAQSCQ